MRNFDIAVGNSRKTKNWRNTQMSWPELLAKLGKPRVTPETVAEYRAMGREEQAEVKDVGGFVAGYLNSGRRTDVRFRSMLCLDADYADKDLWPDWQQVYGCAAAVYSTHKHTPQKMRLRLVVPLARDVSPDEYQALARKVADKIGIDKFDDTTYDPGRLMYWPSHSQDGVYLFEHCDGALLDPDAVLAEYVDWHDISAWPMSSRVSQIVKRSQEKQQDPTMKPGLVGAFCRAYTIRDAIEAYVPDYSPCTEPNRYTYTKGSTAAGVVVYEDKWSYSHHATDPASGQLCNAWDLVRLHKFHALDEGVDARADRLPSYKAMQALAQEDPKVRTQIVDDRLAEAREDFADADWKGGLKTSGKGVLAQNIENNVLVLRNDERLKGAIAYDEFRQTVTAVRSLPWRPVEDPSQWTDFDDAALRLFMERNYGLVGKDRLFDAVNNIAQENKYHPVRDYLDSCTWDGTPRVDTLLVDYLGAEDTPYTRAVTRKTLTAAVARIYRPGTKFDYVLTVRGKQGIGKSGLIGVLGGQWASDTFSTVQGKESYEQIIGVWLIEVGELAGMRKAESDQVKFYISKSSDRFRPAYGRRTQEFPRQCIFIGTTNERGFLRDTTGNRRFWIVDTPNKAQRSMWHDLPPETVAQIWGEAKHYYRQGETLFLPPDLEAEARRIQSAYEEENPRAGLVSDYLERTLPEDWKSMDLYERRQFLESGREGTQLRTKVCTMEIYAEALGGNPDRWDRYVGKELRGIMDRMPGWRYCGNTTTRTRYGTQRYYERIDDDGREDG